MGKFTDTFGGAGIVPDGSKVIKTSAQTEFPKCKHCGGELIAVRADFDLETRSSNKVVACKQCGKAQ